MGLFSKNKNAEKPEFELGQMSVLAIANDSASVGPIFNSLIKFQYKAKLVHDMSSFVAALAEMEPDIILMSLNLRNTNVMKVIDVLQTHDYPCIVFGEEDDEETFLRLLGTEIRHTLLPPLSFESFMERVEFLAMEKDLRPKGEIPTKIGWGKIITILSENLLNNNQIIIEDRIQNTGHTIVKNNIEAEVSAKNLVPVTDKEVVLNQKLDIDVFISMPLNHKCILYLKKGSIVLKENLERLARLDKSRILKRRA